MHVAHAAHQTTLLPSSCSPEGELWQRALWTQLQAAGALPLTALVPLHALCCVLLGSSFADAVDLGTAAQVREAACCAWCGWLHGACAFQAQTAHAWLRTGVHLDSVI